MQVFIKLVVVILLLGYTRNISAQDLEGSEDFEGVLTYEFDVGGRSWTLTDSIRGEQRCTEVFLGETRFQRLIQTGGQLYMLDDLGKRMVLISPSSARSAHSEQGSVGEAPGVGKEIGLRSSSPLDDEGVVNERFSGDWDAHEHMRMERVEPVVPVSRGEAFGRESLIFDFEVGKRKVKMAAISGFGVFPSQSFRLFEDVKDLTPALVSTLRHHQVVPVLLEVAARKKQPAVTLVLNKIEAVNVGDEVFELPSDYTMKAMGGGRQRKDGQKRSGKRGGPPPSSGGH